MDRRTSERIQAVRPVTLRLLGDRDQDVEATLQDFSDGGAALVCGQRVPAGTAIRLDLNDSLYLGEVVRCEPEGESFRLGIHFQQVLGRVNDLRRLVGALVGATRPVQSPTPSTRTAA